MSMNFDVARHNLVEKQVRPWEVLDNAVLAVFAEVQREDFVPVRYRKLAFADMHIPLAHDQVMMKPTQEGRMLQALEIRPDETVLEIGTGSGYIAACLARLAEGVCTVELYADLCREAETRLANMQIGNVECHQGDVMGDWLPEQAHDVVVVTGSVPVIPERFKEWVNPSGRLFVITGQSPVMEARCLTRINATEWTEESLFETDLPALVNSELEPGFQF